MHDPDDPGRRFGALNNPIVGLAVRHRMVSERGVVAERGARPFQGNYGPISQIQALLSLD
jgi:hypothetical protein